MSFLKDAFERLPRPIIEGRGIKVYQFEEITSKSRFADFAVMEGWGWEDVWEDMLVDHSVQVLVQDITELMVKGVPLSYVENHLDELEDKASTRLTTEEKTVLLKWLEKNQEKLGGVIPEAVEPLSPDMGLEQQLAELIKRMEAARRGLGLANRMPADKRREHRSRVMGNLNIIRGALSRVIKELGMIDDQGDDFLR